MSDNLNNLSFRFFLFSAIRSNLCNHLMPGHCPFRALCRNKNILHDPFIIRQYEPEILILLKISNDCRHPMRNDFCNLSLSSFPILRLLNKHFHRIQMKCTVRIIPGNKNIFLRVFYCHKAKALWMCLINPSYSLCFALHILSLLGHMHFSIRF